LNRKHFISAILVLLNFFGYSQDAAPDDTKGTIRFTFMVPQPTGNKGFKKSFTGIADCGLEINYNIKNFVLGAYGRYRFFQARGSRANKLITTNQVSVGGGLTLGFDYRKSKNTIITPYINVGYNFIEYTRVSYLNNPPINTSASGINIEPGFRINWLIEDGFGIGVCASYNLLTYQFNPYDVSLNEYYSYDAKDTEGITQFFSFGFCAFWDWSKRASSDY
jgi:hypothetical protein